jgi:hypothetical protein
LVGATDVGRDYLEDDAVIDLFSDWVFEFGVVDGLHFNMIWAEKNDPSIGSHKESFTADGQRGETFVEMGIDPMVTGWVEIDLRRT